MKSERAQTAQWAADRLADPLTVILDTETTGLDYDDEVVQVAVIDVAGTVLLDTLVRPTRPISAGAARIHGITDARVADAPTFADLAPTLAVLLGGRRVLIYNAAFDLRLLRQSARAWPGVVWPEQTADCVMLAYADWYGDWSEYHRNNRWQPLPGGDHTAHGDCRATLDVLKTMAASLKEAAPDEHL